MLWLPLRPEEERGEVIENAGRTRTPIDERTRAPVEEIVHPLDQLENGYDTVDRERRAGANRQDAEHDVHARHDIGNRHRAEVRTITDTVRYRRREVDYQCRRCGRVVPAVEALPRPWIGFVTDQDPALIGRGVVEPALHVGRHVRDPSPGGGHWTTPGVRADAANLLDCARSRNEVTAGSIPEFIRIEGIDPGGITRLRVPAPAFGCRGNGRSLAPVAG